MTNDISSRQKAVLAALAAERDSVFAPVQIQKLFFLIDENLSNEMGGKLFSFEPYDYGPFDKSVYRELEDLESKGLVSISRGVGAGRRVYSLTPKGFEIGEGVLGDFPEEARSYIKTISEWIRGLSFAELVGSIYKAYPDMRANSVFRDQ